jgi:hypothetical protein
LCFEHLVSFTPPLHVSMDEVVEGRIECAWQLCSGAN